MRPGTLRAREVHRLLGDLAPARRLLPKPERRRATAVGRYGADLFERAQSGDARQDDDRNRAARLASIDRLADLLGRALSGEPVQGAPPSVRAMAREDRLRPWPTHALARLHLAARRRAVFPREPTPETAAAAAGELGGALVAAFLGAPAPVSVDAFAGALLRLGGLLRLGAELDQGRCPLPASELPRPEDRNFRAVVSAVRAECSRLRPELLGVARDLVTLPAAWKRPSAYLLLASLHLLTELEEADSRLLDRPPRIARHRRWALYAKARWLGLDSFDA